MQRKAAYHLTFRPITCLLTIWKLLSGILSDCLYNHLHSQGLLPTEQKGISRGSRGAKSQLLVDKMIMKEAKQRRKNLQMLWLDYKKAYDSVLHSWILECLRLLRAHQSLCNFLKQAMTHWKTELTFANTLLGTIDINCGIFQGDSFSPLLFIVSLILLGLLLCRSNLGYKLSSGYVINHLLYMDDLKLYSRTEEEIQSLLNTVDIFSADIGMSFGIGKCAHIGIRRGNVSESDGVELPSGDVIRSLSYGETY